jgi:hypothetical protein
VHSGVRRCCRTKWGKCGRKPFRLEPKKLFLRNQCTLDCAAVVVRNEKNVGENRFAETRKKFQVKPAHPTGKTTGPCYKLPRHFKHASKTHLEIVLQGVFSGDGWRGPRFSKIYSYPAQWFDPRTIAEFALTVRAAKSHKIEHVPQSYFTILIIRPKSLRPPPPPLPYF